MVLMSRTGSIVAQVVMMQDPSFVTSLELAVRFGKTLIVQEVDNVTALLYPILRRDLFRKDARMVIFVCL